MSEANNLKIGKRIDGWSYAKPGSGETITPPICYAASDARYPGIKLVVHQRPYSDKNGKCAYEKTFWVIAEQTTGRTVLGSGGFREVVNSYNRQMAAVTPEAFEKALAKAGKQ